MKNRSWDREALMREVIKAMESADGDEDAETYDVRFFPNEPEHMRIRAVVSEAADGARC